ncbi:hypothetical protein LZQ00_00015 [Sphingobacterium sp. SRCM116780]|uniref:hypothetical protein n=1 Tax=Sphingobacterium sp. SRCM116780 TaxID=2907623 RepID=UPI001F16A74B|nr:hypothetical protein [Sphingobacterium sp. SRCM116780]UIR56230.1 hypothetical protein LZQ00_00015 [Sphingobacterium sp. SRCM116780]
MHILKTLVITVSLLFAHQEFASAQAAVVPATQAAATNAYKYSPDGLKKGSLANQFDHLNYISKNNYDYKMIRKTNLDIIRRNVVDTVSKLQKEIKSLKSASSNYGSTTKGLQDSVQILKDQLAQEQEKVDSFSFLGINTTKSAYSTVVWLIIAGLLISTIAFLFSYRKAKVNTDEYQKTADQAQEELALFRKKALEKEQALKRQLQDELNKRS